MSVQPHLLIHVSFMCWWNCICRHSSICRCLLIQPHMWVRLLTSVHLPCRALGVGDQKEPWDAEYNFHKHSFGGCGPDREDVLCPTRLLTKDCRICPP
uniref:Secreted protein n=1 Tax=Ixodes ricinus TaxID=34613 RepID=A0A6B0U4W6_IXORI